MPEPIPTRTQRQIVIDALSLLSSGSGQLEYGNAWEIVEAISDTFRAKDDKFNEAFSRDEVERLAEYFGLAHYAVRQFDQSSIFSVERMLRVPEWRAAMELAKNVLDRINR